MRVGNCESHRDAQLCKAADCFSSHFKALATVLPCLTHMTSLTDQNPKDKTRVNMKKPQRKLKQIFVTKKCNKQFGHVHVLM